MIKRIYHTADIHIRTYKYHDEYREVFNNLYESLIKDSIDINYDEGRILIVGDLFHQKISVSNESFLLCSEFITELSKIHPVVITPGNHDLLENNSDRVDSITPIIKILNNKNVNYLRHSGSYKDDNVIWLNYSIIDKREKPVIEDRTDDTVVIGLYHGPIDGTSTDIGFSFKGSTDNNIFNGCDVVMCGDIHKRQVVNHNGIKIVMPGSLIQQDFGETISKHGYLSWDIPALTFNEVDIHNDNTFAVFEIYSDEDIDNNRFTLKNG